MTSASWGACFLPRRLRPSRTDQGGTYTHVVPRWSTKNPALVPAGANRAWEVWNEPPPVLPDTVVAFRLIFPTSELAVRPEQRTTKQWRDTLFIESAPPDSGKLTVVTLFVTVGDPELRHESAPSLRFASLELNNGRR